MQNKEMTGYPSIDKPWLKYYSEEAINAKLPECTIFKYLWDSNKEYLDNIALNYFDRRITYGQMFVNIKRAAKAFSALGVKEGDIVVMTTVTTPETIYAFYGLNRLGAISNMVDPRTSEEGIRDYIKEVDAKFVLTIDVALPKIRKAIVGTGVKEVIVVSPADSLSQPKKTAFLLSNKIKGETPKLFKRCICWDKFIEQGKNEKPVFSRYKKDTCCVIVHTGGTTGTPKGVVLTNDSLNIAAQQILLSPLPLSSKDKFLNIMPPFIAYGTVLGIHTVHVGNLESILIPKFEPSEFAQILLHHKPACVMGVPTHFDSLMCSNKIKKTTKLSFLKVAFVGGDKIKKEVEINVNKFFASHGSSVKISKGYSLTEASATATFASPVCNKLGSAGLPLAKTIIAIFKGDAKQELSYGEVGDIFIQSPTIMIGYYNNKADTAKIIYKDTDGNRWLMTGDYGYMDSDGSLYVLGRNKRIIVRYDGFKVFPVQIENAIEDSSFVKGSCIVGVDDKNYSQGKLPIAFVVLNEKADKQTAKSELHDLCKRELPEYAQPVDFVFIDELPLTLIGKVDYRALEKMAEESHT
ncbi:MAG: acyl--CoA ligase [Ruminococcus sp.]|nr:acyl--CoA ligase [Ruminococcus sp.]